MPQPCRLAAHNRMIARAVLLSLVLPLPASIALEHCLRFFQSQANVLDSPTGTINCLNRDAEWQRAGGFDQHLNSESHRGPLGKNQRPVSARPD